MYDTYIFDLYGTLIDIHTNENNPYLWKKLALYMTLQGADYNSSELKKSFRQIIENEREQNYQAALSQGIPVKQSEIEVDFSRIIQALYSQKGVSMELSDSAISHWAILFRTLSLKHLSLYSDAIHLLKALKQAGKKVYLLSNAQRLFTEPEMRSLGIYDLFDDILYSSDIGFIKPSPLFYQALLTKHNILSSHAVMVGNDDQADIWGAHAMQLDSYYIQTSISPKLQSPLPENCTKIDSLDEIISFLP